jgi:hypothetical protein
MLSTCTEPGCNTLVFGVGACLEHEARLTREFVRGRPFVPAVRELRAGRPARSVTQRFARAPVGLSRR